MAQGAFHTHTAESDGELDPVAHVRHHEWAGYDVCAITDHWTLTHVPRRALPRDHRRELAADPHGEALTDSEILAIGISEIPEDPGGDRSNWGPIDAYHYKTFPDLSAAGRCIAEQGGVSFIAHPYWSGMPLDTLLAAEHTHGIEVFNASSEREDLRGDSSYVWDQCWERGRRLWGFATDDCHYSGFDINDAWTMVRPPSAPRKQCSRRSVAGTSTPRTAPGARRHDRRRRGRGALRSRAGRRDGVASSPGRRCAPTCATGKRTRGAGRDGRGLVVRARFEPAMALPYRRIVIEDEEGRRAWANSI